MNCFMKMSISRLFLVVAIFFVANGIADAQISKNKVEVEPFTAVKAANDFKIRIVKSDSYMVESTVNEALKDYVQIAVNDGVLNIYFEDKKVSPEAMKQFRGRNAPSPVFDVLVSCPAQIKDVSLQGNTVLLDFSEVADTNSVRFTIAENAKVESANVKSSLVSINTSRRGSCNMNVVADKLSIDSKGSASHVIKQEVNDCEVNLGSNISLQLNGKSETLGFTSSGTCKAILNGESGFARFKLSGSSNINAINLNTKEANVEMNSICILSVNASDWVFINISNGASLTFAGEPQIHINSVRNASVLRYKDSD